VTELSEVQFGSTGFNNAKASAIKVCSEWSDAQRAVPSA